jgi:hypothetical protein
MSATTRNEGSMFSAYRFIPTVLQRWPVRRRGAGLTVKDKFICMR